MLNRKAFTFIPNRLEIGGKHFPVILMERNPACWKCGVISHLAPACTGKKHAEDPPKTALNVPRAKTTCFRGQKDSNGSFSEPTCQAKKEKDKQEWQVVTSARGKPRPAEKFQSSEAPRSKDSSSSIPMMVALAIYTSRLQELSKKFDNGSRKKLRNLRGQK